MAQLGRGSLAYVGRCVSVYHKIIGWIHVSRVQQYLLSVVGLVLTLHVCWNALPILVANPSLDCFLVKGHPLLLEGLHDTSCCYSDSLKLVVTFFSIIDGAYVQWSLQNVTTMTNSSGELPVRPSFSSQLCSLSSAGLWLWNGSWGI